MEDKVGGSGISVDSTEAPLSPLAPENDPRKKAMATTPSALRSVLFAVAVAAAAASLAASGVAAQSLPPPRRDGFVYTDGPVDSDTVVVEAFLDPVCPDSRDAWPPLKQALQYYGPRVWLVVHLLPLPCVSVAPL